MGLQVEEFALDDVGDPHPSGARGRDAAWRWVAVAALLTGAGLVAAPPHPSTDGINLVASLAAPPTLRWEAPLTHPLPNARLDAEVLDDVVTVTTDATVTGYDVGTGEQRWQVAVDQGRCTYQDEVVCVSGRGSAARVVAVEPGTGVVDVTALPDAAWALRVGDDLVSLIYSQRTQEVVRLGPGGDQLWSTEVPYQPGIGGAARGYPFARICDRLYVGTAGPVILDLDDGATLARPLLLRYDPSGIYGFGFNETWWHLWSGEQLTLTEGAARLAVDDDVGSRIDVLVSAATGVAQLVEGSSEPLWSGGELPIARLDGVLVTVDDGGAETHGVDLTSGDLLWTAELMTCPCLGSGDTLLVTGSSTMPSGLTAVDVRTGLPVWQLAFPPATSMVELVDGGVVVAGVDRLLFYGW